MKNHQMPHELFNRVATTSSQLATAAIGQAKNIPDAIYLALGAVNGALMVMCTATGHNAEDDKATCKEFNPGNRINADTMLFSALLVVESVNVGHSEIRERGATESTCAVDSVITFGPQAILDALTAFEKLTGRKPDDKLNSAMVQAGRSPSLSVRGEVSASP